jgi:hypothetical protein
MNSPSRHGVLTLPFVLVGVALLGACGGETGPSYSGSIDSLTLVSIATDNRSMLTSTLVAVFKNQGIGMPVPASGPPGSARQEQAIRLAITFADRIGRATDVHGLPHPSATLPVLPRTPGPEAVFFTCQPVETGVDDEGYVIDSDGDGVPDDYSADFGAAGCSVSDGGFVRNFKGKYRIQDTGIGFRSFRFTGYHLLNKFTYGGTGEYVSREVDGVETASLTTAGATHTLDVDIVVRINTYSQKQSASLRVTENTSFDATGGALSFDGALPNGTLSFAGEYVLLEEQAGGRNYRFEYGTTQPLTYTSMCGNFTDGTLRGALNGGSDAYFSMDWTGCNSVLTQYVGFE